MASTVIEKGRVRRRTKRMPFKRAQSFAKALALDPRQLAREIVVIPEGTFGRVEFEPARKQTIFELIDAVQASRRERAVAVRSYEWRRISYRRWRCTKPTGEQYFIVLAEPGNQARRDGRRIGCNCLDWDRVSAFSIRCKHYICALEAEKRWQTAKRMVVAEAV